MEVQLREIISEELRQRHGFGMMEGKIKPVHIANALMREEHHVVGSMKDLKQLMIATAPKESPENRLEAARTMLERNRERWGRLGEEENLRDSVLVTRVLPLLRTILGTDNAVFGTSPEFSSFSSATALTITRDVSDDHAGAFVHRLWGGTDSQPRLQILDLLRDLTHPNKDLAGVDDLTAVLVPLADDPTPTRTSQTPRTFIDLSERPLSGVERRLRSAAEDLERYESAVKPNPIATLQRLVLLASISVFFHAATRSREWAGMPDRVILIDASSSRDSTVAEVSTQHVGRLLDDSRAYMASVLKDLLDQQHSTWWTNPVEVISELFAEKLKKTTAAPSIKQLHEVLDDLNDAEADIAAELPRRLVELLDGSSGRSLDGFLRMLGLRSGLLYPQQKNPKKRLVPMDRTLEVLVVSTFNIAGKQLEYRDFLEELYKRWGIIVGGRLEDAKLLADSGSPVPSADLAENSERFLSKLQSLGLASRLADSVAVVGLMENVDDVA
ncbi:MAG: hypothetical protein JWQ90_1272 [Hydrocarboniphaga sp.]|uniref:hypothetical protein n=1 Tax=Hydrocarboniphaga sp. TaxID=2033016 RepID=UPI002627EB8E|nr:hypothetical protein [Hydrocarboniphaga sp.]MDB5968822.1 hypothetical protein [Hydrocarboniphaga sp.]